MIGRWRRRAVRAGIAPLRSLRAQHAAAGAWAEPRAASGAERSGRAEKESAGSRQGTGGKGEGPERPSEARGRRADPRGWVGEGSARACAERMASCASATAVSKPNERSSMSMSLSIVLGTPHTCRRSSGRQRQRRWQRAAGCGERKRRAAAGAANRKPDRRGKGEGVSARAQPANGGLCARESTQAASLPFHPAHGLVPRSRGSRSAEGRTGQQMAARAAAHGRRGGRGAAPAQLADAPRR